MALRVHIQHLCLTETMVSTLRRVPFGRTQKEPKGPRPIVRPSLRSGSLAPALLRGPAAMGHGWPVAALPASMPVDPLRRTSSRPPGRAGRSKALRPEAADRPACSVNSEAALAQVSDLLCCAAVWLRRCYGLARCLEYFAGGSGIVGQEARASQA